MVRAKLISDGACGWYIQKGGLDRVWTYQVRVVNYFIAHRLAGEWGENVVITTWFKVSENTKFAEKLKKQSARGAKGIAVCFGGSS